VISDIGVCSAVIAAIGTAVDDLGPIKWTTAPTVHAQHAVKLTLSDHTHVEAWQHKQSSSS
jgi:hypothetical protein